MERVKGTPGEGKIKWKKHGRGFFRLPNLIIKPNDVFWARPDQISKAFRDTIIPVNHLDLKEDKPPQVKTDTPARREHLQRRRANAPVKQEDLVGVKPVYTKVSRGEGNPWFDIFDANGKKLNEKALRSEQADEYMKSLAE